MNANNRKIETEASGGTNYYTTGATLGGDNILTGSTQATTWTANLSGLAGSSPLTTKGDIYVFSSSNTRLPVGANGKVLKADSSTTTGLVWGDDNSTPGGSDTQVQYNNGGAFAGNSGFTYNGTNVTMTSNLLLGSNLVHNGDTDTYLGFETDNIRFYAGNTNTMNIKAAGVGIGTNSPAQSLDVRGTTLLSGATDTVPFEVFAYGAGTSALHVTSGSNTGLGTATPLGKLHINASAYQMVFQRDTHHHTIVKGNSDDSLTFATGAPGSHTARFKILPTGVDVVNNATITGNVGIGAAPTDKLNINTGAGTFDFRDYNLTYTTSLGIRTEAGYLTLATEGANDINLSTNGFANKRLVVKSDGKVGIGTNNPSTLLDVVNTSSNWAMLVDQNNTGNLAMKIQGNYGLGISSEGQYPLDISTASSADALRMLDNGNLGLGTVTPVAKLHISESTSADVGLVLSNSDTGHTINDGFQLFLDTSKNAYLINREASDMKFYTSNAQKMVIKSDGKVGIGTTGPNYELDVNGSANVSSNLHLGDADTKLFRSSNDLYIRAHTDILLNDTGGNVGVGIDPTSKLHVKGDLDIQSGNQTILMGAGNSSTSRSDDTLKLARVGLAHYHNSEEPVAMLYAASNGTDNTVVMGGGTSNMNAATKLQFATATNDATTAGTNRMTITGSNVGIGITAPQQPLHVLTSANDQGILIDVGDDTHEGRLLFGDTSSNAVGHIGYNHSLEAMRFFTNSSEQARLDATDGLRVNKLTSLSNATYGFQSISSTSSFVGNLQLANSNELQFGSTLAHIQAGSDAIMDFKAQSYTFASGSTSLAALDDTGLSINNSGKLKVVNASNNYWAMYNQSNGKMRIDQGTTQRVLASSGEFQFANDIIVDGQVGIGGVTPSYPLHINGTATQEVRVQSSDSGAYSRIQLRSATDGYAQFNMGDSGADAAGGLDYTHSSDTLNIRAANATQLSITDNLVTLGDGVVLAPHSSDDFTIDSPNDIVLDYAGNNLVFKSAGTTFGKINNNNAYWDFDGNSGDSYLRFIPWNGGAGTTAYTYWGDTTHNQVITIQGAGGGGNNETTLANAFFRQKDAAGNTDTYIQAGGDSYILNQFGLGTSSPSYILDVFGSARIQGDSHETLEVRGQSGYGGHIKFTRNAGSFAFKAGMIENNSRFDITDYQGTGYEALSITSDLKVGIGNTSPKTKLTVQGALTLKEQAAADADTADFGQIWVKNTAPNTLYFTDDAGTDHQLGTGGGGGSIGGTVSSGYIPVASSTDTLANGVLFTSGATESMYIGATPGTLNAANYNTTLGYQAGDDITEGDENTLIGQGAGANVTTGGANTFIGRATGFSAIAQTNNTVVGSQAGQNLGSSYNTMVGAFAGYNTAALGNFNSFFGFGAGQNIQGAALKNIAIGLYAHYSDTDATSATVNNIAIGTESMKEISTGYHNIAIGAETLLNTKGGNENVAVGHLAMKDNTSGKLNVAVGAYAATGNTTGQENVAVGTSALQENQEGDDIVAVGRYAAYNTNPTAGTGDSVAIGSSAAFTNTTGVQNVVIGRRAAYSGTTANNLVVIGREAGEKITTGSSNVLIGMRAGYNVTKGAENVMIGQSAGQNYAGTTSGVYGAFSVFIGHAAGYAVTGGHSYGSVMAIGHQPMYNATGAKKSIAIGQSAVVSGTNAEDVVALGNGAGAYADATGSTYIGNKAGFRSNGNYNTAVGYRALSGSSSGDTSHSNVAIGYIAMEDATSAIENVAIGIFAGNSLTTGDYNTVVGSYALRRGTSAGRHVAIGYSAMNEFIQGDTRNTAVGMYAMFQPRSGSNNVAVGYEAMRGHNSVYDGDFNTVVGSTAMYSAQGGDNNTIVGYEAGYNVSTGGDNVLIGYEAGYTQSTATAATLVGYKAGTNNTANSIVALGKNAGFSQSSAANNTFIGFSAGHTTSTAGSNVFVGYQAGYPLNTTHNVVIGNNAIAAGLNTSDSLVVIGSEAAYNGGGGSVVAIGKQALYRPRGNYNIAIGEQAMYGDSSVTTASENVAIGRQALNAATSASSNVAVGYFAGYSQTTGDDNTFIGVSAGKTNTTAAGNVAIGKDAMKVGAQTSSDGGQNSVVGYGAYVDGTGQRNAILGYRAAYTSTSANSNVAIGYEAGQKNTTGDSNVFIGNKAGPSSTSTDSNKLYIHNNEGTPLIGGDFSAPSVTINGTLDMPTNHGITFDNTNNNNQYFISNRGSNAATLVFGIGAIDNANAKITMDGDGDLGIGTTTPAQKLHVVGNITTNDLDSEYRFANRSDLLIRGNASFDMELISPQDMAFGIDADDNETAHKFLFKTNSTTPSSAGTTLMEISEAGDVTIAGGLAVTGSTLAVQKTMKNDLAGTHTLSDSYSHYMATADNQGAATCTITTPATADSAIGDEYFIVAQCIYASAAPSNALVQITPNTGQTINQAVNAGTNIAIHQVSSGTGAGGTPLVSYKTAHLICVDSGQWVLTISDVGPTS